MVNGELERVGGRVQSSLVATMIANLRGMVEARPADERSELEGELVRHGFELLELELDRAIDAMPPDPPSEYQRRAFGWTRDRP